MTKEQLKTNYFNQDQKFICFQLKVDPTVGLTDLEAKQRLNQYGPNRIEKKPSRSVWRMFIDQFTDVMILVLIVAAFISGVIGEAVDAIAILVIVLINAIIGFIQEYRAERAIAALRQMSAPTAVVIRDGQKKQIDTQYLVPGDIVSLEAGNIVPADLRLLELSVLNVDEAALTGESVPVSKIADVIQETHIPLGEQFNMVFKGTLVTEGNALAVVVSTGMQTELGHIAELLTTDTDLKTPLQKRLAVFGRRLAIIVLAICAIIFGTGLLRGEDIFLMFLTAVTLAVAAIPEALPAVATISLALGARKMVLQNALIRRLPAVETLGSITYICSDKTGTLTQNSMHVESFYVNNETVDAFSAGFSDDILWKKLGECLALSNDAYLDEFNQQKGDPTELALFNVAAENGVVKTELEKILPRLAELPFDAKRKRMTTFHQVDEKVIAYSKGSPESIIDLCHSQLMRNDIVPVNQSDILDKAEQLAAEGFRVLALSYRDWDKLPNVLDSDEIETDMIFLGLVALMDPPRPEAAQAVAMCKTAGITPIMITGDHPATAKAIASRLGIAKDNDLVITGKELQSISLESLQKAIRTTRVFARVTPEQKIRIVDALQSQNEFVAMTGDGVNDAPALKRADIGVAMGLKGTDVAREASDVVLLDDNFATIVSAIREGRRIYDNIRKFIKYVMTSNSGEILTLFLAPFLGLPIPLLPVHILWINLVTDGLPGLALAFEQHEPNIMQRPPRPPNESIFSGGLWQHALAIGLLIAALSLFIQAWAYHSGFANWQTMVFTTLTFSQLVHSLSIRFESDSIFSGNFFTNPRLLLAVLFTVFLQLLVIYLPWCNDIFKTQPLSLHELMICSIIPWIVLIAVETEKWLIRKHNLYGKRMA